MTHEHPPHTAVPAVSAAGVEAALRSGQLRVVFQPVVDFASGTVRAAEALVRWDHPVRGRLLPGQFLPDCDHELIGELGEWVLEQACAAAAQWRAALGSTAPVVSVNVSAVQLSDPTFPDVVLAALARHGLPGTAVTLELTEHLPLTDAPGAVPALQRLRAAGLRIALDDFGTGYAWLTHLAVLPVDVVKLDQFFISGFAAGEPTAEAIVVAVLGLARSLRLLVVAEGVEDEATAARLAAAGALLGQGYGLGRPVAAEDLTTALRAA